VGLTALTAVTGLVAGCSRSGDTGSRSGDGRTTSAGPGSPASPGSPSSQDTATTVTGTAVHPGTGSGTADAATSPPASAATPAGTSASEPAGGTVPQAAAPWQQNAGRIAGQVLTAAAESQAGTGRATESARETAFTGTALRAARAEASLAGVAGIAPQLRLGPPAVSGAPPPVLAVSAGQGYPRVIVVEARPRGSLYPVLYLLSTPRAGTAHRIAWSATVLPSAKIHRFAAPPGGAPMLPSGAGLSTGIGALIGAYAKGLSYPVTKVTNPPYRAGDRFAAQLDENAALEAGLIKAQASFTQQHRQVTGSTFTIGQVDGGALVFSVLERTDAFAVRPAQKLAPSPKLLAFEPKLTAVTSTARLTTLEFLVFQVPAKGSQDRAELVAASEHLVAGSGR
jgi:hypothetical protein